MPPVVPFSTHEGWVCLFTHGDDLLYNFVMSTCLPEMDMCHWCPWWLYVHYVDHCTWRWLTYWHRTPKIMRMCAQIRITCYAIESQKVCLGIVLRWVTSMTDLPMSLWCQKRRSTGSVGRYCTRKILVRRWMRLIRFATWKSSRFSLVDLIKYFYAVSTSNLLRHTSLVRRV